jgi:hypothetical protein
LVGIPLHASKPLLGNASSDIKGLSELNEVRGLWGEFNTQALRVKTVELNRSHIRLQKGAWLGLKLVRMQDVLHQLEFDLMSLRGHTWGLVEEVGWEVPVGIFRLDESQAID